VAREKLARRSSAVMRDAGSVWAVGWVTVRAWAERVLIVSQARAQMGLTMIEGCPFVSTPCERTL